MAAEVKAWAGGFDGVALLAVEESDGAQDGALRPDIEELLAEHHAFAGALLTLEGYQMDQAATGARLERVRWIGTARSRELRLEYRSFGQNVDTWADGRPVVTLAAEHAREDWDFFATPAGSGLELVDSLRTGTHLVRLSRLPEGVSPQEHAPFREELRAAVQELQRRLGKFRPARRFLRPFGRHE